MLYFGSSRFVNVITPEIAVSGCMMLLISAERVNMLFSDISDTPTNNTADTQHCTVVL